MKRLPIMIIGVSLLAAACGTPSSGSLGPAPTTTARPPSSASPHGGGPASTAASPGGQRPAATATPGRGPAREIGLQAWFSRNGKLFVTERTVPATTSVGRTALDRLLTGPSAAEYAAGLRSQLVVRVGSQPFGDAAADRAGGVHADAVPGGHRRAVRDQRPGCHRDRRGSGAKSADPRDVQRRPASDHGAEPGHRRTGDQPGHHVWHG